MPPKDGPHPNRGTAAPVDENASTPATAHLAWMTLPEREATVRANERITELREEAADLREDAASLREQALGPQEEAMDLREDAAGLREDAAALREQGLRPQGGVSNRRSDLVDRREAAADRRDEAAAKREQVLQPQEQAANLRETAAGRREEAAERRETSASHREQILRPREGSIRDKAEHGAQVEAQLREANEHLVLATLKSQTAAAAAVLAAEQMAHKAKIEAHLQEVQRLAAINTLAAGVAHDFNNLHTAILGNAELGQASVLAGGAASRYFAAIEGAAIRAADLTRQLLAYTGQGVNAIEEVDLGKIVTEIHLPMQFSLPNRITLDFGLAKDLPLVKGDATQLFQIAMNLTTNAGEAFEPEAAGCISIRTRAERLDRASTETAGWILPLAPGSYVTLEVSDTGCGMTPEVLARAFDPFYSTKFTGRGLGLAAVIGLVRSHGGGLRVFSEPSCGTTFKVFLPEMTVPPDSGNLDS